MTQIDMVQMNQYIKNKYLFKTDILYTSGTEYLLIDFHSTSGDPYMVETLNAKNVTEQKLKQWIREKLT